MGWVLKITGGLLGVVVLIMVGVMAAGRHGKDGSQLILMTYTEGDQAMLGWVTDDFQHMRSLGRLCSTWWYPTLVERPDENWLYVTDECSEQSKIGWAARRIHVISGAEDIIATRMVSYSGSWSPDNRWFVFQEQKNASDDDLEVEWVRVAPDGTQRLVLSAKIPAAFRYSQEYKAQFSSDSDWVKIGNLWGDWSEEDIYRIRIDGTAWENLTADVGDVRAWLRSWTFRPDLNISRHVIEAARERSVSNPSVSPVCLPGDVSRVVVELPTKQLRVIRSGSPGLRGISAVDGSILWEVVGRDLAWISPDEEWVLLGGDYTLVYELMRWDGSDRRLIDPWFQISDFWSPDMKWLVHIGWDRSSRQASINRIAPDSGTIETLFASTAAPKLIARSPDGQVFYFTVNDHHTKTFAMYAMRFDGSGLTRIKILDPFAVDHIERFMPPVSHDWHPTILGAAGISMGAVIFISGRVGRRRKSA